MLRRLTREGGEPVRGAVEHFYRTLVDGNLVADTLLEATREVDGDSTK